MGSKESGRLSLQVNTMETSHVGRILSFLGIFRSRNYRHHYRSGPRCTRQVRTVVSCSKGRMLLRETPWKRLVLLQTPLTVRVGTDRCCRTVLWSIQLAFRIADGSSNMETSLHVLFSAQQSLTGTLDFCHQRHAYCRKTSERP